MSVRFKLIGLKFYRYSDDSDIPKVIRLIGVDEVKRFYKFLDCSDYITKIELSFDEVESNWIKLNPDGLMSFNCCFAKDSRGEEVPDLMVNLHKINKDKGGSVDSIPYVTCRQAVIDIFALLQDSERYIAGMSISRDTCPPELNFRSCCAFSKITKKIFVAVYMDDHINEILSLFNHKSFDERLKLIKSRDKMGIPGYQTTLESFLKENYFMLDFHTAFGIHELKFKSFDFEDDKVNRVLTDYIISNLQEVPIKFYPIPYSKYIDLKDIKRKYILVCPFSYDYPDGEITLLAYDVSQTISFKDLINKGDSPKDAKDRIMKDLGWT